MYKLLRYKKEELGIESISIMSNGLKITKKFLRENAAFINTFTISYNSFDLKINIKIGRGKSGENMEQLTRVAS
jgi:radical S-adenosyl methionine domain-containing protein 2